MRAMRWSATEDVTHSLDIRLLGQRICACRQFASGPVKATGDDMMT
jgi:hypothetical protein